MLSPWIGSKTKESPLTTAIQGPSKSNTIRKGNKGIQMRKEEEIKQNAFAKDMNIKSKNIKKNFKKS